MPPKAKVTREQVVEQAALLVRERGISGLTAKALAERLHCSTQPIFWLYASMEEVKEAVQERALLKFDEYLRRKIDDVSAYKAIGLNYIRFATEETEYFKMLFMSKQSGTDILKGHIERSYVLGVLAQEENIKGDTAQNIYEEMWLFSHGIATMLATGTAQFSGERIDAMLSDVYRGLVLRLKERDDRQEKEIFSLSEKTGTRK